MFRYKRYVELFETKLNEATKMRAEYDSYSRRGFCETPASLAITLRELKARLPDLTWDKLKDIAVLRLSHEDRLDELADEIERCEDIVRRDEIRMAEAMAAGQAFAELTRSTAAVEDNINNNTAPAHGSLSSRIQWSTDAVCELDWLSCETPIISVRSEAEDEAVTVVVVEADEAMEADPEADGDRAGTMGATALTTSLSETSSTMADLEAMFSRILEKPQAAHGATGGMPLVVELADPFLSCVDNVDHGPLLNGVSCVDIAARELRDVFFGAPGIEPEALASYKGCRGGGTITSDMLDIRNQQLMQRMRTALQHAKFPGLPVAVVSDMTPGHAARLDTGCDYSGVHRRVVDRMKPGEIDAPLQSMSMQGIGGEMERISYAINPDTDWERKFEWPSLAVLEGDHLPEVIIPMNADLDSDVELPDMAANSDDDDHVHEEHTIVTQTEPEIEASLHGELRVAGACYAMRAEDPNADNPQEPDCPSGDAELEDCHAIEGT
eukprot:jgi/Tetstr1/446858/TSEL_034336.t1